MRAALLVAGAVGAAASLLYIVIHWEERAVRRLIARSQSTNSLEAAAEAVELAVQCGPRVHVQALMNLAGLHAVLGDIASALPLLDEALLLAEAEYGEKDIALVPILHARAEVLEAADNQPFAAAAAELARAREIRRARCGENTIESAFASHNLASLLVRGAQERGLLEARRRVLLDHALQLTLEACSVLSALGLAGDGAACVSTVLNVLADDPYEDEPLVSVRRRLQDAYFEAYGEEWVAAPSHEPTHAPPREAVASEAASEAAAPIVCAPSRNLTVSQPQTFPHFATARQMYDHLRALSKNAATKEYVVRNFVGVITDLSVEASTVETELFPRGALEYYTKKNMGWAYSAEDAARWQLQLRGGEQGDYRAGIDKKIANAIACLKSEPLSKRATITFPFSEVGSEANDWTNQGMNKCCRELHLYLEDGKLKCTGLVRMQNANIFVKNIHFFATLLEHVAGELDVEVGEYTHWITNLCYDRDATSC